MAFDESKYKETSELVKKIDLNGRDFNLFEIDFFLRICPHHNPVLDGRDGKVAEYTQRREGNQGFIIYSWGDLGEKIQRPLIFHQVVEIYHLEKEKMEKNEAHRATIPWEKRFCQEYLNNFELENYFKFKGIMR